MRPAPIEIHLGERTWTIRPFSLGHLEVLEPIVAAGPVVGNLRYGKQVLAAALHRDYPEDAAAVDDLEGTPRELAEASRAVLALAGYLEDTAPGEAEAAQGAAASTSDTSSDASSPRQGGRSRRSKT